MFHGVPSTRSSLSNFYKVSAVEWGQVVAANGDFSVIGIDLNQAPPIPNFEELVKCSQNRTSEPVAP